MCLFFFKRTKFQKVNLCCSICCCGPGVMITNCNITYLHICSKLLCAIVTALCQLQIISSNLSSIQQRILADGKCILLINCIAWQWWENKKSPIIYLFIMLISADTCNKEVIRLIFKIRNLLIFNQAIFLHFSGVSCTGV